MSWNPYLPGSDVLRVQFLSKVIEYRDGVSSKHSQLVQSRIKELAAYDVFTQRQMSRIFGMTEPAMKRMFKQLELAVPSQHGMDFDPSCLDAMHLQVARKTQGWSWLPEVTESLTEQVGPQLLYLLTGIPKITYYAAKKRRENRGPTIRV